MFGHFFMIGNDARDLAPIDLINLSRIDKMQQHHIQLRVCQSRLADNPFHSPHLFNRGKTVGIIIHCRFFKEQINGSRAEYITLIPERPRGGTERGDSRIDKLEPRFGESPLEFLADLVPPTGCRRNRTTEKRDAARFFLFKFSATPIQPTAQSNVIVPVRRGGCTDAVGKSGMSQDKIHDACRIFQAMRMVIAVRFCNQRHGATQGLIPLKNQA